MALCTIVHEGRGREDARFGEVARPLLWGSLMLHSPRDRSRTWMTVACLAVGVQGGHAIGSLALGEPTPMHAQELAHASIVDASAPTPTPRVDPKRTAWCSRPSLCFVDLDRLEAQPSTLPRGLRLVPDGEGLRIDGARGLLTRLGLRNGDVLLAIDEHLLEDGDDLSALYGVAERGGFSLRYRRGERVLSKRINLIAS